MTLPEQRTLPGALVIRRLPGDSQIAVESLSDKVVWQASSPAHSAGGSIPKLFFKWIKQHLRIKAFYGTSDNAVKTQIWIAVSTYFLVAIIRKRLHLELNLYTILQILSVTLFEKMPIDQLFANFDYKKFPEFKEPLCKQLNLFNY